MCSRPIRVLALQKYRSAPTSSFKLQHHLSNTHSAAPQGLLPGSSSCSALYTPISTIDGRCRAPHEGRCVFKGAS
ncbi:hypothetical protein AMECASPLE_025723 [Ameca splendens]|uniref:Uncharacterized protein n=1 Tax=Ameca splendens TaxID=208324 RepID=A0ABV0XTN2_9TELE